MLHVCPIGIIQSLYGIKLKYFNLCYNISVMSFDIVIPLGSNDVNKINNMLSHTINNIIGYRHIYIVSYDKNLNLPVEYKNIVHVVDENIFPFNINSIAIYHGHRSRNGWYLQQLLKLYASIIIDGVLERYLVIDSDTVFLKPTEFIKNDICLYNVGSEHHIPYFTHMKKLHSSLEKQNSFSGICHHMIFEKKYILELFKLIEEAHGNKNFWVIFLENVDKVQYDMSGSSEYEIYFNYMLKYHKNNIIIRKLKWENSTTINKTDLDYISAHWYL